MKMRNFVRPPPPPQPVVPDGIGFAEMLFDPTIQQWVGGLLLLQIFLQLLFTKVPTFSAKPGVAAHQFVSFIPFIYATVVGGRLLFYDPEHAIMHQEGSYTNRLYQFHAASWNLNKFMVGFQLWDLFATALVPGLCRFQHVLHHVLGLLTAISGSCGPFLQFYAAFFFGFIELSSVPLAAVDLFREFPALDIGFLHKLNELSRVVFALSFLLIRCVYWPFMMRMVFCDLTAALQAGDIRSYTPMLFFFVSGSMLTVLQYFWGFKIVKALSKMATGNSSDRSKET